MKKIKSLTMQLCLLVVVIILIILVPLFYKKVKKEDIARLYKISRPTLSKWIHYFQKDFSLLEWKGKRFLNHLEHLRLIRNLGDDLSMVLSKGDICKLSESDYKTVSENVKLNFEKLGISIEAWENCSVFPPNVSKRILCMLG